MGLPKWDLTAEFGFEVKKSDGNWLFTIDGYFFFIVLLQNKWQKAVLVSNNNPILIAFGVNTYNLLWMEVFIRIYWWLL